MIVSLILLAVLTIGAVSASDDFTGDSTGVLSDVSDESVDLSVNDDECDDLVAIDDSSLNSDNDLENMLDDNSDLKSKNNVSDGSAYTFGTIREQINDLNNNGGIISLSPTTYVGEYFNGLYGDGIVISQSLTIYGNGATLDAKHLTCIFYINHANVVFRDINFVNSTSVLDKDSNSVFNAIYCCNSSSCTIENCNFTNCGGASGSISCYGSTFTIENSKFVNSEMISGFENSSGEIRNCNFDGCGIGFDDSNCAITDCTFINSGDVGTFYGSQSNFFIANCSFDSSNGIECLQSNSTVIDCTFLNCYGGITCNGYADSEVYSNFTITNCIFVNTGGFDSAICVSGKGSVFNCSFVNSKGFIAGYNCTVYNCTFENFNGSIYCVDNFGSSVLDCSFVNCSSNGYGGVIRDASNVVNCSFVDCSIHVGNTGYGGYGGAIYNTSNIVNCSFVNCYSPYYGGAIYGASTVLDCSFENCSADYYGGAIYNVSSVINCDFIDCSVCNTSFNYGTGINGGAINTASEVLNCSFVNCSAERGGAVYNASEIANCDFTDCSAEYGGAVFACPSNIVNSNFINCTSEYSIGGIYSQSSIRSNATDSTFVNCDVANVFCTNCTFIDGTDQTIVNSIDTSVEVQYIFDDDVFKDNYLEIRISDIPSFITGELDILMDGNILYNITYGDGNYMYLETISTQGLELGEHTIESRFTSDEFRNSSSSKEFNIYDMYLDVSSEQFFYEDDERKTVVVISLPENIDANFTVSSDGNTIYNALLSGSKDFDNERDGYVTYSVSLADVNYFNGCGGKINFVISHRNILYNWNEISSKYANYNIYYNDGWFELENSVPEYVKIDVSDEERSFDDDIIWYHFPLNVTKGKVLIKTEETIIFEKDVVRYPDFNWWEDHYGYGISPSKLYSLDEINDGDIVVFAFLDENGEELNSVSFPIHFGDGTVFFGEGHGGGDDINLWVNTEDEFSTADEDLLEIFANVDAPEGTQGNVIFSIVGRELYNKALNEFDPDRIDGNIYNIALKEGDNFIFEDLNSEDIIKFAFLDEDGNEVTSRLYLIFFGDNTVRFEEFNDDDSAFDEFRDRINDADDKDTIDINDRYLSVNENIGIFKSLTINGNGAVLDAKGRSSIFYISSGNNVTIRDIVFMNANAHSGSAILIDEDSYVEIINCTFINCQARGDDEDNRPEGGAIRTASDCYIADCSFTNCHSDSQSGAIHLCGQIDYLIENSNFTNCHSNEDGGAVQSLEGNDHGGSIVNCIFRDCSSGWGGAAKADYGTHSIINSTFTDCSAGWGGAVSYYRANATIDGCVFENCNMGPDSEGRGGAVNLRVEGNYVITDSIFTNCDARFGGAVDYDRENVYEESEKSLTISDCTFTNCHADVLGGAIHSSYGAEVIDCEFTNCTTDSSGNVDGIFSGVTYTNCIIYDISDEPLNGTVDVAEEELSLWVNVGEDISTAPEDLYERFANVVNPQASEGTLVISIDGNDLYRKAIRDWNEDYIDGKFYNIALGPDGNFIFEGLNNEDVIKIAFLNEDGDEVTSREFIIFLGENTIKFEDFDDNHDDEKELEVGFWDENDERGILYTDSEGWVVYADVMDGSEGTIFIIINGDDENSMSWDIECDEWEDYPYHQWHLEDLNIGEAGQYNITVKCNDDVIADGTLNVVEFNNDEYRFYIDYGEENFRLYVPEGSIGTAEITLELQDEEGEFYRVNEDDTTREITSEDEGYYIYWDRDDLDIENGKLFYLTITVRDSNENQVYRYSQWFSFGGGGYDGPIDEIELVSPDEIYERGEDVVIAYLYIPANGEFDDAVVTVNISKNGNDFLIVPTSDLESTYDEVKEANRYDIAVDLTQVEDKDVLFITLNGDDDFDDYYWSYVVQIIGDNVAIWDYEYIDSPEFYVFYGNITKGDINDPEAMGPHPDGHFIEIIVPDASNITDGTLIVTDGENIILNKTLSEFNKGDYDYGILGYSYVIDLNEFDLYTLPENKTVTFSFTAGNTTISDKRIRFGDFVFIYNNIERLSKFFIIDASDELLTSGNDTAVSIFGTDNLNPMSVWIDAGRGWFYVYVDGVKVENLSSLLEDYGWEDDEDEEISTDIELSALGHESRHEFYLTVNNLGISKNGIYNIRVVQHSEDVDVYNPEDNYFYNSDTEMLNKNITVITEDKIDTTLTVPDVVVVGNSTGVVVATLKDSYGNVVSGVNVKIVVGSLSKTAKTNKNGQVSLEISGLAPGEYTISARSSAQSAIYKESRTTAKAIIYADKLDTTLTVPDVIVIGNSTANVVATLKNSYGNVISGVNVKIVAGNLSTIAKTNKKGQVSLDISSLSPGQYIVSARSSAQSAIYKEARATAGAIVSAGKLDTILTVPDVIVIGNSTGNVVATLKDSYGNVVSGLNVKIVVGSLSVIAKTDANGQVSLDISGLTPGEYTISARSSATSAIYKESRTTAKATVSVDKLDTSLTVQNVYAVYNVGGVVVATLKDIYGNLVSGVNVKIVVGDLSIVDKTNAKGQVSLDISDLAPGEYVISARSSAKTDIYKEARATAKAIVSADKLDTTLMIPDVIVVGNSTGVVVATLKDSYGNVVSGVNVKIVVGDLSIVDATDENGQVTLDITSLKPGEYTISARSSRQTDIYKEARTTAKAIVSASKIKTVLTAADVTTTHNSGEKLVATLKDSYGNAVAGVKVRITVGTLDKILKTNSKGQVGLDVSTLDAGTYTATIKSAATDVYVASKITAGVQIEP